MRNIFLKPSAILLISLLAQACMEHELRPSITDASGSAAITKSQSVKQNVKNSFSAVVRTWSLEFPYAEITLEGAEIGKTITINWGDGTIETHTFTEGYGGRSQIYMEHYYSSVDEFTITMTGDLSNVVSVISPLTTVEMISINFDKLTNLVEVHMPYNSLETLDLSKNRHLQRVYAPSSTLTRNIILPKTHEISFMASGSPNLPTKVVSAMIESIYRNAVTKGIYNGRFELASGMVEDPTFPGPPTEEDMEKLIALRDVYGWTIFPNP
jgi:hypothetical protein